MLIRFDKSANLPTFIQRNEYFFETTDKIIDVGSKCLPRNLQDVFRKAVSILENNNEALTHFTKCQSGQLLYRYINNINKSSNILYNIDIYNNCPDLNYSHDKSTNNCPDSAISTNNCPDSVSLLEMLKSKAKGNLLDLHYFPTMFKGDAEQEYSYIDYNLRRALIVMIEMESALQWLIGYNTNIQFIIEPKDIEKSLWSVANRLSYNKFLKSKAVNTLLEVYNNLDVKFISSHYNDYWWNIEWFIGRDKYIQDLVNYEKLDKSKYIGVYLYGDNREEAWHSIKHKVNPDICLFVDNPHKMALKRIQKSMAGKKGKFKEFVKSLIGDWFDVDLYWNTIRRYIDRIDDSSLPDNEEYDINYYKGYCIGFFNNLGEICYTGWKLHKVEDEETSIEDNNFNYPQDNMEIKETEQQIIIEEPIKYNEIAKTEDGSTDWNSVEIPKELIGKKGEDFWETLNNL